MAGKKTKENISKYDKKHLRRLAAYQKQIDAIFDTAAKEAAAIGAAVDPSGTEPFSFADYPLTRKRLDKLLQTLADKVEAVVVNGINAEWDLADEKNNELVKSAFGSDVSQWPQEQRDRYFTSHADARAAFLARKVSGLNLSERVWNYAERFKDEIELALDLGISEGKSATSMARELKQYLRHPDMLFRRVRDKYGVLHLSKRAKAYHPGRGVYRSSYKNALRLAATETNIAYHTADYERWQSLDFVVGIEISLSNNHTILDSKGNPQPFYDICDELAGKYPKGFKFTGWHPFCRCHAVPVLMTEKELMDGNDRIMQGKEPSPESVNEVKEMPKDFNEWVERNADRIKAAQERGTEAYFIKDNAQYIGISEQVKKGSANAVEIQESPASKKAKLRHKMRTDYEALVIQDRWTLRRYEVYTKRMDELLKKNGMHNVDPKGALMSRYGRVRSAIENEGSTKEVERLFKKYEEGIRTQKAWNTRKATYHYGRNMLNVMGGISDVGTSALADALKRGNQAAILVEATKLKTIGKRITALEHLNNPLQVAKTYSMADAVAVNAAVVERIKREGINDLSRMKKWLESEINWVEAHKKYSTWKVAQDAYKKELSIVERKIAFKSVADSVDDALAYGVTTRSKKYKALASEMRTMLSSSRIDIATAKAKAAELNKQYNKLRNSGLKKAKVGSSGNITFETIDDLKKRLGKDFPKTLPNLENAIKDYEKNSGLYGSIAKSHKDEIETLMRKVFDKHDLGMNIDDDTLEAVLNSWFKNTFETGSSGGFLGSKRVTGAIETSHERLIAAHNLFGLDKDLAKGQLARRDYEKYGNLLDHDKLSSITHNTATDYGNVEVRFKKNKVVATWTAGDSLSERFQPSLVSDPRSCSFDDLSITPRNAKEDIADLNKFKRNHIVDYLELQFHGDLTIDCVESLTFPYDLKEPSRSKYLAIAERWKKKVGAKIYYVSGGKLLEL